MTALVLDRQALTELPALPADLVELSAWDNEISSLPDSIGSLQRLQVLILAGNRLAAVPPSIASLTQLRTLDLGHNQLTTLPSRMPDVAEYLYLHDTGFARCRPGWVSCDGCAI
jgi:Leucine-rich repeat (LRR) protein